MPCLCSRFCLRVTILKEKVTILKGKMAILGGRVITFRAKIITWEVGAMLKRCEAR